MRTSRRWAAGLLAGAFLAAVVTPGALAYLRPSVAGYLLHPAVFLIQSVPYGVAAALLVPDWSWGSDRASALLAGSILALSLALYVPILLASERWGGDMVGLAFLAMSGGMLGVIVVACGLTALVLWFLRRSSAPEGSTEVYPEP